MNPLTRWIRRARHGEPIVVVSGLPRSGTSMTMKMLEAGGLTFVGDGIRTADEDNPKGYYEHERIKDLASETDKTWIRASRGRAIKVISYLLRELPPDNNYRVLFMNRDLDEVIASQNKMLERRGERNDASDARMKEAFQDHLFRVRWLLRHQPQFEYLELTYHAVLADPAPHMRRIAAFVGRPLDVDRMAAVADQQLYRNRRAS